MEQAVETSLGPNQAAAKGTGMLSTYVWLKATIVCPKNVTQKRSGCTENTLIQEPIRVPPMAKSSASRKP
jgi:hypothetical protein